LIAVLFEILFLSITLGVILFWLKRNAYSNVLLVLGEA